ncbi:MFS transporter [Streptomyces sp. NPDC059740]|uniref:MFS transporter n=1 Tax=Streptomyces sp. NPDC059740 TaxID=3346926 RepID=UPI00364682EB
MSLSDRSPTTAPPAPPDGATARPTRVRHGILALLAIGTLVNYLDRAVVSVAAPDLSHDLGLGAATMGVVFSAFGWSYAVMQIPGGLFLDRFGSKVTYGLSVLLWSLVTAAHALVAGLGGLLGARLALGAAESPCFPANSRVVATWFPQRERATATGVYTVGEYVGMALISPLLYWITGHWGWRVLFGLVGAVGVLFGIGWWATYREPHASRRVNRAELDLIEAGGGLVRPAAKGPTAAGADGFRRRALPLLRDRRMLGISLGQFAGNSTLVFFLTWFPTYLETERGMDFLKVGFSSMIPFLAACVGVLFGGWSSDTLLRRGASVNLARKLPVIAGLLLASTIVAANYADDDALVIAIMSVAFFAQGMAALGWTLVSDIAPAGLLGLAGGLFNFAAMLASILTPLVVGALVGATGSFVGALLYIGAVALVGAAAYVFLVGDVKRIEMR